MNRPSGALAGTVRIVFLVLMAVLTLFLSLLFLAVFVPVIGWYVWKLQDRTRDLEQRLAAIEGPKKPKTDQT